MAGLIGSDGRAGVYWLGSNGSTFVRNNLGQIVDVGSHAGGTGSVLAPGADATIGGLKYRAISDPNPPQKAPVSTPAPSNPTGSSGGGGTAKVDKSNDIALQMAGLGAVDQQTAAGTRAVQEALGKLFGQYDTETAANEKNYTTQSDTNQNNLQTGKQSAYVNAAMGRRSLFGTLSSLGALNGSGIQLANRAVQKGANDDLSGAAENFSTNQTGLDTSISSYRLADKTRRDQNQTASDDAIKSVNNNGAKSKQSFYSNLANDYATMGDTANAKKYTTLAASLYPQIADTSIPSSNLAYTAAAFQPTNLTNYLAGANSTQVTATPASGGGLPGLMVTGTNKKKSLV